jgi:two-component system chemotaxis response regulator CheB
MIRIVIAEDSLTTRALLHEILSSDPEIQVIGQAKDGLEAVALTQQLHPDLVTMDIHMPHMDGLAATKEIMITAPTPIVIVTGSSAAPDVGVSLHALRAGALDVVEKPPGPSAPAFEEAARKLVALVKAMAGVKVVRHWRPATAPVAATERKPRQGRGAPAARIVAIVASTGGPAALQRLLAALPGEFPAPILVVQHIAAGFADGLAAWLTSVCDLHVKTAEQGEVLQPRTVYLAPDGSHLGVTEHGAVSLSSAAPIGGFRPSGTFLFDAVARVFGKSAVGIVLTGMGNDGAAGVQSLRQRGAEVIAQDESSSVVFGMPGAVVAAGLAGRVLPLDDIAPYLAKLFCEGV